MNHFQSFQSENSTDELNSLCLIMMTFHEKKSWHFQHGHGDRDAIHCFPFDRDYCLESYIDANYDMKYLGLSVTSVNILRQHLYLSSICV